MEFTAGFTLSGGGTFVAPLPPTPPSSYLWAFGDPGRSLGVGDNITRSKSSYANLLLNSKTVNGKVIAWPDINLKQLRVVDISRIAKKQGSLEKYYLKEIKEKIELVFGIDL